MEIRLPAYAHILSIIMHVLLCPRVTIDYIIASEATIPCGNILTAVIGNNPIYRYVLIISRRDADSSSTSAGSSNQNQLGVSQEA